MPRTQTPPSSHKKKPPFPHEKIKPPGLEARMKTKPKFDNPSYIPSEKLKDKRVLITGGDSGIGRAVAILFAKEGADIAITHLVEEKTDAKETVERIKEYGRKAFSFEADVSNYKTCQKVTKKAVEALGGLDILVNNAAFQNHVDSLDDLDIDQFEYTFKVNVFGYFYMIKSALPYLTKGANIINTASILGFEGSEGLVDYSATKGAILTMTKSLAKALGEKSIRVNAVSPGPVWTPLNPAERKPKEVREFGKQTLFGRPAQPEEIAPAYLYLASDVFSSYVTGESINLFGDTSGGN